MNICIFRESISPQETKHQIFKHCLGYSVYNNFDDARCGHKDAPAVVFRLKTAININEFMPIQFFNIKRK
jgi:hypothetical protein